MTDAVTQPAQADEEAQALEAAKAGYNSRARAQAPAEPVAAVKQAEQPLANSVPTPEPEGPDDDEPNPLAEPAKPTEAQVVARQLDDLKAQVRELQTNGADAATVRKMHGEIGSINGALQELLAATKAEAPEKVDELEAALKQAEETASEYPEIAKPLLTAIRVMQARMAAAKPEEPPKAEPEKAPVATPAPTVPGFTPEQLAAIRALDEVHPDRHDIVKTAEYQTWLKSKPADYQKKVTTSWNPAVVAQPFTDFKAFKAAAAAAQKRNKDRLDAAVTPTGTPQQPGPTALSDSEAARRGYQRYAGKR